MIHPLNFYDSQVTLARYLLRLATISLLLLPLFTQSASAQHLDNSSATNLLGYFILFIFFILIICVVVRRGRRHKERSFSAEVRKEIRRKQGHKCAICKWNAGVFDYDHKDGNRNNNDLTNCQALCPNCHAKKTRGLIHSKRDSKRHSLGWLKVGAALFLIFVFMGIFIDSPK